MTREEVVAALGMDVAGIERGLGVGVNYLRKWVSDVKGEEQKYTDWWNTELKKREDMEVASSVRAASRSIQARRLLKERAAAQEAAANAAGNVIGQGSIPAGWAEEAARKKAARELEEKAAEGLKDVARSGHAGAGAMREVMVVIREAVRGDFKRMASSLSILGTRLGLTGSALGGFATVLVESAAILYFSLQTRKAAQEEEKSEERMKTGAHIMAKRLRTDVANFEKVGKISHETAQRFEKILSSPTLERNRIVIDALRKLGGPVTKHDVEAEARADEEHRQNIRRYSREDMNAEERAIMSGFKILEIKGEMAKLDRTSLEYKKKQLDLDQAQRDLLTDQKEMERQKLELQQKQTEEQRIYDQAKIRMADLQQREREKFMPTLDELAHHGRFGMQARAIARMDRRIKRDFEFGNISQADKDIAARTRIYDSLADRGVTAERTERREMRELQEKIKIHVQAIAEGKAVLKTKLELK